MKKMILDLDTGVDDALAISYALGSPEIELIGITGTYGNVLVEQGVRNALAVTDLLGHPEVKVYQGLPHGFYHSRFAQSQSRLAAHLPHSRFHEHALGHQCILHRSCQ